MITGQKLVAEVVGRKKRDSSCPEAIVKKYTDIEMTQSEYPVHKIDFDAAERVHPVTIPYESLLDVNSDVTASLIQQGLGRHGLGLIAVSRVPKFSELRQRLLPIAYELSKQPEHVQKLWEDPESSFNVGWSFGKEMLQSSSGMGRDTRKGSWYANPLHDFTTNEPGLLKEYPSYTRPNIWPTQHVPDLESAFKDLGQLMYSVGKKLLDRAFCSLETSTSTQGVGAVSDERCVKGRLLCYLPSSPAQIERSPETKLSADFWCGWHKDHGSLTALCPAYYVDDSGEESSSVVGEDVGLYVQSRNGGVFKVLIDKDTLAFQVGEALQVLSGGALQATPHCVLAPSDAGSRSMTRCTFALFMQPYWDTSLSPIAGATTPSSKDIDVQHWHWGISFGEFSKLKFSAYYGDTHV